MKKIFLAAFITLCGAVLCFGEGSRVVCEGACMQDSQTAQELQHCIAKNCGFSLEEAAKAEKKVMPSTKGTITPKDIE